MKNVMLGAVVALFAAGGAAQAAPATSAQIEAALVDPARPAADRDRDAGRKVREVIALSGIGPGDTVADFIMGSGYLTHVLAGVVGSNGKVYAYQPDEFIKFRAAYGEEQKTAAAAHANVVALHPSIAAVAFPEPLDAVVTVQNYHDLHLKVMTQGVADAVNAALFAALKPGGTFLVIDHSAPDGSGFASADREHRAERAAVKAEIEKAGFVLDREANFLANPDDPRTALVFDPAIRGKTDQFVLLFRKPK